MMLWQHYNILVIQIGRYANQRLHRQITNHLLAATPIVMHAIALLTRSAARATFGLIESDFITERSLHYGGQVNDRKCERLVAHNLFRLVLFSPLNVKVEEVGVLLQVMRICDIVVEIEIHMSPRGIACHLLMQRYLQRSQRTLAHLQLDRHDHRVHGHFGRRRLDLQLGHEEFAHARERVEIGLIDLELYVRVHFEGPGRLRNDHALLARLRLDYDWYDAHRGARERRRFLLLLFFG
jgi:hypothetical protein